MKFSKSIPVSILMLGCGGTGGYVAPHLYRLLSSVECQTRFIVADGDIVEKKNLIRQNFIESDLGQNKAKILAERYATAFGMEVEYIPEFIETEQKLIECVKGSFVESPNRYYYKDTLVILIGAVDNNKSRKLCHEIFKKAKDIVYIDSGNGMYTGQIVCGIKRNGKAYYKPVGDVYPDILEAVDKFPSELSCADAAVSEPQSIVANILAATAIVSIVYNIVVLRNMDVHKVTFSTSSVNMRSERKASKSRKQKAA